MQEEKQSYRWIIASIIYSGAIMMALIWNSIGPMMLTIIEELQISFTKAGLLSGVVAFVLGIFAFVSGSIAGRIGLKVTTCTGITVMAIGCIISGLTSEYMVMMTGRIIFAVGAIHSDLELFYAQVYILISILLAALALGPWIISGCIKIAIRS